MPDVFISFSAADQQIAGFVHDHLEAQGISVFSAAVSINPGQQWTPQVFENLTSAKWVVFLASRAACASPYVQQEVGAAIVGKKTLIPIVWDMDVNQLPGWVAHYQVLNLNGKTFEDLKNEIIAIARRLKQDQMQGLVLFGLIFAGIAAFSK